MDKLIKQLAQDANWNKWVAANSAGCISDAKNGCISVAKQGCISQPAAKPGCIS
ncbi:hypothetical protein [Burkholderia sp. TSV86]|uniref:hypothetical protein n=1 Tax=Burkholderia sp. TSV86 TaxID=1385594 RepID=UPI000AA2DDEB|nr:hypothetical protein [Burkholderia sp. TSV86]